MKKESGKKTVITVTTEPFAKTLKEALTRKALGYDSTETVEEFSTDEGDVKLTKKRVTVKNVPPDVTALKMLMDETEKSVQSMTDEELEKEKARLLAILAEEKEEE